MAKLREKIGYAVGDAAAGGITWKVMSIAFPLFFTNIFGLTVADTATLMLIARMFDVVTDPLTLSAHVAGCVLVIRQNYSDHREIRKALISIDMTGMNVLGFVFCGEKLKEERYYGKKYYQRYYSGKQSQK